MSETSLYCIKCGKLTVKIEHAHVRNGVVTYCKECHEKLTAPRQDPVPDFLRGLFK